jgi:predicted small lipoprotein YifL
MPAQGENAIMPNMRRVLLPALALLLAACGQKGPLHLPDKGSTTIKVTAPAATAPSQTPDHENDPRKHPN